MLCWECYSDIIRILLCGFSWRDINKCLFTPDRMLMTDQQFYTNLIGELMSFWLPIDTRVRATNRSVADWKKAAPPQKNFYHHNAEHLGIPIQLSVSSTISLRPGLFIAFITLMRELVNVVTFWVTDLRSHQL